MALTKEEAVKRIKILLQHKKAGNRLFLNWFKEYASPADFIILSAHQQIEEQGWYASIIVSKANPLLESIKEDFYDMIQGFQK